MPKYEIITGRTIKGTQGAIFVFYKSHKDLCPKRDNHRHGVKCPTCGLLTPKFSKRLGHNKF